jgi:hypothetical protein
MHFALQIVLFWALCFVTLCVALVLLGIYYNVLGSELELRSIGQEAAVAGLASLLEGVCVWFIATFAPQAALGLVAPALLVAFIYKFAHLEDWGRYEVALFVAFQLVLIFVIVCLFMGHFKAAVFTLAIFNAILALVAFIVRSL